MKSVMIKRNGKYKSVKFSNKFYKNKPRTKRMRKKKFWLFCKDCSKWFNKWEGTSATREDGGSICNTCFRSRMEKILEERGSLK